MDVLKTHTKETETAKWIGKHVPISVSISPNLIQDPVFLYNDDFHNLVSSFIRAREALATRSKTQMKLRSIEVETAIKIKLCGIPDHLNKTHNRADRVMDFVEDCSVESEEQDLVYPVPASAKESINRFTGTP